ncbi:TRAP transporter small permease [Celeribacter sp.]|uniref:TRAP transporter small permease n=1 Tax=Celeribacter sp. TaxID=1890673 RepID=UPI003A8FF3BF
MKSLEKLETGLAWAVFVVTGIVMIMMVTVVILSVVMRYIVGSPLVYSYDLSTLLFAWAVFLGLALAEKSDGHLAIDLFSNKLTPRGTLVHQVIKSIIVIFISTGTFWIGWKLFDRAGMVIPSMRISIGWLYASMPIGFALLALEQLIKLLKSILTYQKGLS